MNPNNSAVAHSVESTLAVNKLIRNTYTMLAMTLLFSALMAGVSLAIQPPPMTSLLTLGGAMLLIWLALPRTANSTAGLGVVFGITGLLGFGLGPMLEMYLALSNGPQIVGTALGGTGVIFLGLSGYALATRRDFSFMGGFLFVGMLVILAAILANIFLQIPALSLTISAVVIMLMSGFILYDTGRMVNGGESNYLLMTVSLYLSIFNIFIHLLNLLAAFAGRE
ncbi:Bax inhibitor-1/YccA family protein [Thiohalomonas denitrificans]|uniref:Modulator of FtsH protease n=1 Tax=Thiohalomonas denitrificans TaxID=415747 RepID=A0A1G5QBK4_9GAMM|nr:Bax inhibitor-1/YccA family protein [Thiohalomonas denitrificans]SCZ58966.1 modulator of FtsH protease [Thiohalomonas denitrificans]